MSLIHQWTFNDADGSTAADSVGSLALTKYGTVTKVAGVVGDCAQFDGSTGYYRRASVDLSALSAFSVTLWFRFTGSGLRVIAHQTGTFSIQTDASSHIAVAIYGSSTVSLSTTETYNDSTWHHLALVYTGSAMLLYIDGVEVARDSVTGLGYNASETYLKVGCYWPYWNGSPNYFWAGELDDLRWYDHALTIPDLAALVRPGGILLRKGQYLFGPSSILPPTGQTTSVHDGDDGDLQVGRTITPRMQHNLDGTVTDHATGLMWVWKPHRLFPGSHPTQSNQTQTARGLWAFSTAYQVGDVVGIGTPFSTAWMGSGTAGSYYTYGGATWLCLTNTTDTPGTSAAWEFHSPYFAGPYVCITAHTSAAPPAAWAAYTAYSVGAVVDGGGGSYWQCTTAHTSTDTMQYEYWTFCMNAEAESAGWTTDSAKWVDAFPFVQDASSLTTTGVIPWTAALDAIDTLNTGEGYAGYADWRMPNLLEMLTLVNYGSNPLALYVPFTLPGVGYLTTATTAVAATSAAFAMDTAYGTATTRSYSEPSYLWLVRGGR